MRKYLERMLTQLDNKGSAAGGIDVIMWFDNDGVLNVTHYGTKILEIRDSQPVLGGGWSATDQTIINAVFEYYHMHYKCKRHYDELTIVDLNRPTNAKELVDMLNAITKVE